jgi:protein transport protein SEC31
MYANVEIAAGDRSHIPDSSRPMYEILNADMQRVKARAPAQYRQHVADTEKRLNILFDHLNNEDLLKPDTIQDMNELAGHLQAKNYDSAIQLFTDLMTNKTDEGSNWMVSELILTYKTVLKYDKKRTLTGVIGRCEEIDTVQ